MYHVKRAIIVAAGIGERLRPVTASTPKPLVRVNGVPMIETIIDGLRQNGIREIHVVVGYLKEQFSYLTDRYPGLDLIDNPYYDSCNNIASLYVARDYLEDVIILDGDQIVRDPAILDPAFTRSGYNAVWTDEETREWLLTLNRDGIVTSCSRVGGAKGWQLYSISRWNREDGSRLRRHLELEFIEKENRGIYWDDVALFCHPDAYQLGIREMSATALVEIDSYEELVALDSSYQ